MKLVDGQAKSCQSHHMSFLHPHAPVFSQSMGPSRQPMRVCGLLKKRLSNRMYPWPEGQSLLHTQQQCILQSFVCRRNHVAIADQLEPALDCRKALIVSHYPILLVSLSISPTLPLIMSGMIYNACPRRIRRHAARKLRPQQQSRSLGCMLCSMPIYPRNIHHQIRRWPCEHCGKLPDDLGMPPVCKLHHQSRQHHCRQHLEGAVNLCGWKQQPGSCSSSKWR